MRIARYVFGDELGFGVVELEGDGGEHPETIAGLTGDPMVGSANLTGQRLALADVRLVAPVLPRSKIVGVGKNYAAHAAELGGEVPETPLTFLKPNTSVVGPGEPVIYPEATRELHYEGELAVVINRVGRDVPVERAAEMIYGYTVANDVTCRDLQRTDGQWTRAKGYDTFCPLGPWIVTHLSIDEAGDLGIVTRLNGEVRQQSRTSCMVRSIAELIAHISSFTTLLPADVILTGTPEGVGAMQAGDSVSVEIEEIGTLTNPVLGGEG